MPGKRKKAPPKLASEQYYKTVPLDDLTPERAKEVWRETFAALGEGLPELEIGHTYAAAIKVRQYLADGLVFFEILGELGPGQPPEGA